MQPPIVKEKAITASQGKTPIEDITLPDYRITRNYFRVLNLIISLYICFHTFRSHTAKLDPKTMWIPFGYVFLAVSEYSLFLWQLVGRIYAFFVALILRLVFLSILLVVSFGAFYRIKRRRKDEKDCA